MQVVRASHLSEPEKRAFMLADNELAELATWNETALRRELEFLSDLDIDFDSEAMGFDTAEVDVALQSDQDAQAEQVPRITDAPAVTSPGDLWQLGEHTVYLKFG